MKSVKKIIVGVLVSVLSAMIAIVVHIFMPSPGAEVNVEDFDSRLVSLLGFPLVASLYFVILYLQIWITISVFGRKSKSSRLKLGLCYGMSFGLMYLVAMQEVVIEGSPCND
ncbi:MAG: hypothetical protein Q4D54_02665 [Eubacteriales bacterium]|nr:hypothetical protein [Eubacteriales bacterium]